MILRWVSSGSLFGKCTRVSIKNMGGLGGGNSSLGSMPLDGASGSGSSFSIVDKTTVVRGIARSPSSFGVSEVVLVDCCSKVLVSC